VAVESLESDWPGLVPGPPSSIANEYVDVSPLKGSLLPDAWSSEVSPSSIMVGSAVRKRSMVSLLHFKDDNKHLNRSSRQ